MDPNARLLSRVVHERSRHGRLFGVRVERLLVGTAVLLLAAALQFVRTAGQHDSVGAGQAGTDISTFEALNVPTPERIVSSEPPVSALATPETVQAEARRHRYVVQPGDSLQSIAARNGLRPSTLASVNALDQPELLEPGRNLVIPSTDGFVHVVQPGETLRSIAERYNVDLERLVSANDVSDPDHIPVGLRLFVPGPLGG